MAILQAAGVPCGVVQDGRDKTEHDAQLAARQFLWNVQHTEIGERACEGPVPWLARTPGSMRRGAPLLGEHTDAVLREVLGMSDDGVAQAIASGACQ